MPTQHPRRTFIRQFAALSGMAMVGSLPLQAEKPLGKQTFQIGCAAITWGDDLTYAIDDISALGFKGIQLRANAYKIYGQKPQELYTLLQSKHLSLPVFSVGEANFNTENDDKQVADLVAKAKFFAAVGGQYGQLTNGMRPRKGEAVTPALITKYAQMLNNIGGQIKELGITAVYHNHMGQLGETPQEIDAIMEQTDPDNVKFLLDIAHYWQGGGDPLHAFKKYRPRIPVVHLKDVRPDPEDSKKYKFVELGEGKAPVADFIELLQKSKYNGWAIVELDGVTDAGKTPVQCAQTSKKFLTEKMGLKL